MNFSPFPSLTTTNFNLCSLHKDDVNEIFEMRSDPKVTEFLDREIYKSINEAEQFIQKIIKGIEVNEWIYWAIRYKDTPRLIGSICLWNFTDDKTKADIGYELISSYHGKGVMQEIIPVVLDYGFKKLGLQVVFGEVARGNIKSIRLMQKYGFELSPNKVEDDEQKMEIYYLAVEKWRKNENPST